MPSLRVRPAIGEQVALEDGDGVVVGHQFGGLGCHPNERERHDQELFAGGCLRRSPALCVSHDPGTGTAPTTEGSNTTAPAR
jgi:hypothetical protein